MGFGGADVGWIEVTTAGAAGERAAIDWGGRAETAVLVASALVGFSGWPGSRILSGARATFAIIFPSISCRVAWMLVARSG